MSITYTDSVCEHQIKMIFDNGKYVLLDNLSVWAIHWLDRNRAFYWSKVDKVIVTPSYPYTTLINISNGEEVRASLVEE